MNVLMQWIGVTVLVMIVAIAGVIAGAQEGRTVVNAGPMLNPSLIVPVVTADARDFGDYTSATLTKRAWDALNKNDSAGVELYTNKCIELYEQEAKRQQASLQDFAPQEVAFEHWALNDVATAYLIKGLSHVAQGHAQQAERTFQTIIQEYSYAQAWNSKGWMWKVQSGARDQLALLRTE